MTTSYPASRRQTKSHSSIVLAKAQVSCHLSRRHPYYLTQGEAHALIDAADNKRDRLVMRLLWETGVRVSEAITVNVGDVGRDGIRVLGSLVELEPGQLGAAIRRGRCCGLTRSVR